MRILLALVIAGSLAACTSQGDNGIGRPPPETGRAAPADTSMQAPAPSGAPTDTSMGQSTHSDSTRITRHDSI